MYILETDDDEVETDSDRQERLDRINKKNSTMVNAKDELLAEINRNILCAKIEKDGEVFVLKVGYSTEDFFRFISSLDFEYDSWADEEGIEGIVWFDDGTWLSREEKHDYTIGWEHHERPSIDEDCI